MKKLIPLLLMVSACSFSYAESMKFITVLSSPVGTFNKLEAVDPAQPAKGNTVNFCTNIGTQGVVELKGTKPAALSTVSLSKNTTLGKTDEGKFSLNNITLKQGGSIRGGRLFANTVIVNNAASGKANNLYGNQLTVAGAKTKTLDVNSGASKITTQHAAADMVWSNEYQSDTACGNTAACAKQYLLKESGSSVPSPAGNIVCAEDSRGGCGSAFDSNGNPNYYWKGTPLCSDVNGWDANFEGECVYIKDCNLLEGNLSATGAETQKCTNSSAYNQCGTHNNMQGDAWRSFLEDNPTKTCSSFCTASSIAAGYCSIPGTSGGVCIVYSRDHMDCSKITLTCQVRKAKEAIRRTCKRK